MIVVGKVLEFDREEPALDTEPMTATTSAALLDAIRVAADDPYLEWLEPPEPLTGGFWAELWQVSLTTSDERNLSSGNGLAGEHDLAGKLVARVMPDPHIAARETIVQKFLADHGFATPRVRLWSQATVELDSAWMLMDLVEGEPIMPDLGSPTMLARLPRIAFSLPNTLARCTADLHRVPVGDLADQWHAVQETERTGVDATAEYLQDLLRQATILDDARLARFASTLHQSREACATDTNVDPDVICHGDLQPFNVLLTNTKPDTSNTDTSNTDTSNTDTSNTDTSNTDTGSGPDYVALDWSTARVANRCHDLAYTSLLLRSPPLEVPGFLSPMIKMTGRLLARRFLKSYERFSDTTVDPQYLDWFVSLHALRVMTDVATWQHEGTLDQHSSHPYILMSPGLRAHYL